MNCEACRNRITGEELLRCIKCMTHYHYMCLNITQSYYKANLGELRRSCICPLCINVTRRKGNNCNTPVRKQLENRDESSMSCEDLTISENTVEISRPVMNTVENTPTTIRNEVSDQIAKLKSEFTVTTDFLAEEQRDVKAELKTLSDKVRKLEDENVLLQSELSQMNETLQVLDKSSRNCNIEIQSVPEKRSENLLYVLMKLCEVINCPFAESDIKSIRRVAKMKPSSDRPRNIIATLHSEHHRDTIISAVRRFNKANKLCPLNSSHMGLAGEKYNIYISEHLSAECKAVHAAARQWTKINHYKFVWIKYGRVYVRKNEESLAILIRDTSYLSKLSSNNPV
ncbi:unnamed protein product [Parnassius apollo]|uniref:(apollo) hypothetical protein n=1 Tax=Parnassius apollo TaxID=110799 RepID=A0A8S3W693_PARAO|nr:unnamed protein product [Parnassius apollo]